MEIKLTFLMNLLGPEALMTYGIIVLLILLQIKKTKSEQENNILDRDV